VRIFNYWAKLLGCIAVPILQWRLLGSYLGSYKLNGIEETFKDLSLFCYISIGTEVQRTGTVFYNIGLVAYPVYPFSLHGT
jgi:hypothetical protein